MQGSVPPLRVLSFTQVLAYDALCASRTQSRRPMVLRAMEALQVIIDKFMPGEGVHTFIILVMMMPMQVPW